mgnify:CR=1 FL=1
MGDSADASVGRCGILLTQSTDMRNLHTLEEAVVPQTRKRLYLDVCTICRPYDDQDELRMRMETDAYYLILTHVQLGRYVMVVSPVHLAEVAALSESTERVEVQQLLKRVGRDITCSVVAARKRAEELTALKLGIADAAHVAYAEMDADVMITCDVRLYKQCKRNGVCIPVFTPVEFAMVEGLE